MSKIKQLIEDYVEAKHPCDELAQDELFKDICIFSTTINIEEMHSFLNSLKNDERHSDEHFDQL